MKVTRYIPSWIAAVLQKSQHFRNLCINLALQVHKKHVHQSGSVSVSDFQQFGSASIRKFSYHGFLQMTAQGTQSNEI
jgi:hypothetical protein